MKERSIAYFTMEIALESSIPTYSGGLGVLAGDTIRSAADLKLPLVAVTLLHRKGYFRQELDDQGRQHVHEIDWDPSGHLEEMPERATVQIEDREVSLRAWRYVVRGIGGHEVPVIFIDADLMENAEQDRELTGRLYVGDDRYRLAQEVVLGIGGVRMVRALGMQKIERFHMNEGHAALLTVELLQELVAADGRTEIIASDIERVREQCVFTTHTPVPAGHDQFPLELVDQVLHSPSIAIDKEDLFCVDVWSRVFPEAVTPSGFQEMARRGVHLNMTYLALNLSGYINGVAKKHGEVSRLLFAGYAIDAITNGVHAGTWVTDAHRELFDEYIPGWREDNFSLRYALNVPGNRLWDAHQRSKQELFDVVRHQTGLEMNPELLTLGFARRAARYKRGDLLLRDPARLMRIAKESGGLQIIYAGKAHPQDEEGAAIIERIFEVGRALQPTIRLVYLEDYDTDIAKRMVGGVDVWINTPLPPNEASGTSGMKAALNGVPSLSILDGWWIEGHIEDVTGWSIGHAVARGPDATEPHQDSEDADSLYGKLEHKIVPMYYTQRDRFIDVMRHAIALNGSFFNTQRMVQQYAVRAYLH